PRTDLLRSRTGGKPSAADTTTPVRPPRPLRTRPEPALEARDSPEASGSAVRTHEMWRFGRWSIPIVPFESLSSISLFKSHAHPVGYTFATRTAANAVSCSPILLLNCST